MAKDRTLWGVHMPAEFGARPIAESFVAIGWAELGDLAALPATRQAFREATARAYPTMKPAALPTSSGVPYRFVHEIQDGDVVISPSKPDRIVHIGTIVGGYRHDAADPQYPNRRAVRWQRAIARPLFSQSALYEIGSALTLFQVRNNAEEFLAALEGEALPDPIAVDDSAAEPAAVETTETTRDFVIKRLHLTITPYQFEAFVAHLLTRMGYHARVTQKSGDGGVDILASRDPLGFEPPLLKVQCKQTLGKIGQPEIAQLYGHVEPREHGLFVTLGEYTRQARDFERAKANLRLLDGPELVDLVFARYGAFDPKYQAWLPLRQVYVADLAVRAGEA